MNIQKRDGRIVPFNIDKLKGSLLLAFNTVDGESDDVNQLCEDIVGECACSEGVTTKVLGDTVEKVLMERDNYMTAKNYILYRDQKTRYRTLHRAVNKEILADYIHISKYARGNETWSQTVRRCMDMHRRRYGAGQPDAKDLSLESGGPDSGNLVAMAIDTIEELVVAKKILPSMRSLQFGGRAIERQNERMYNCTFTHVDRLSVFGEVMYYLLCGCGVTYSVYPDKVESLGYVLPRNGKVKHFVIPDTIEGWAEAVDELVYSYMVTGVDVEFSYHQIRDRGTPLVTTGGRAPGHQGLKAALEMCRRIFEGAVGRRLRPIECYDMMCHISSAVLSGGIRRAATMCLFQDLEMFYAKTGNWASTHPWRAYSNNSVVILRDGPKFQELVARVLEVSGGYGEPGMYITDSRVWGINPCAEIGLDPYPGGFAVCNLTEINCSTVTTVEDFEHRCYWAGVLGTLQAGYDSVRSEKTLAWIQDNRLIGVSLNGVCDCSILTDEALKRGRAEVVRGNQEMADKFGWPTQSRVTCVKPSGTSSLLLGAIGSGIHPHPAPRYVRRIVADGTEPWALRFEQVNPTHVKRVGNKLILSFPIESGSLGAGSGSQSQGMLESGNRLFEEVLRYKELWVDGPNPDYSHPRHNVSVTIETDDPNQYVKAIVDNKDLITALSFVPKDVHKKYNNAPREPIDDEVIWDKLTRDFKYVDYTGIEDTGSRDHGSACEGPKCDI